MTIATLTPAEAQAQIAQGARLIDIRDADEYAREHISMPGPERRSSFTARRVPGRRIMRFVWPRPPRRRRPACWQEEFRRGKPRGCW